MTLTFGIEIETTGIPYDVVGNKLRERGLKGCKSVYDGSPSVDAEIVTPVLALCQRAVSRYNARGTFYRR